MKTCPNCEHENDESNLFCAKCGTKLEDSAQDESVEKQDEQIEEEPVITQLTPTPFAQNENTKYCSNCGKPVDKSAQICPYCGERQAVSKPKPLIIPTEANISVLLSIVALIYSVCGALILAGVFIGIIAIYLGSRANKLIKKETIYGGRDRAIAGIIIGVIAIVLNVIFLIIWSVMFSLGRFSDLLEETMFL